MQIMCFGLQMTFLGCGGCMGGSFAGDTLWLGGMSTKSSIKALVRCVSMSGSRAAMD